MQDNLNITGRLRFILKDESGVVTLDKEGPNLIVTTGKAQVAALIAGTSAVFPVAMAVGTGTTTPVITDTTLNAEIARAAFASATQVGAVATFTANFGAAVGTGTIGEAGLFSSATPSTGTMTSRSTSLSVVKGPTDTLQIIWTLTVA